MPKWLSHYDQVLWFPLTQSSLSVQQAVYTKSKADYLKFTFYVLSSILQPLQEHGL